MTMIPFAPAAAPGAAPSGASTPARTSGDLGAVFSALVDALTEEFLPTDESSAMPEEQPATDAAVPGTEPPEADPTTTDAVAVVAMLLAGSAPAELAAASVTVDGEVSGISGAAMPAAGQNPLDATLTAPVDVAPDSDVAPGVGDADGPVDATATLETGVEAGPVPPASGGPEDDAARIGLDTEPGTFDVVQLDEAADAPAEVLPTADQDDAVELVPVTTDDDPAEDPADGDAADADSTTMDGLAADGPERAGADAAAIRPNSANPGSDTSATAAVAGPTAPAPSAPTHAVTGAAAPAEPTPAALPDQLVTVLTPLRRGPDGTHRVAIQLRPDELGEVQIDVQVRGNEIALSVRADLPGTVDLLRASVAELRAQLEAAGFQPGDLDVTGHGADGATDDQRRAADTDGPATEHPSASASGTDDAADAPPPSPSSATGLDLRL